MIPHVITGAKTLDLGSGSKTLDLGSGSKTLKSLKPLPSRTPIRTNCPDAPDIRTLRVTVSPEGLRNLDLRSIRPGRMDFVSKRSKPSAGGIVLSENSSIKLSTSDKIHQKFKSEYNAFMNQLRPSVHSSGSEHPTEGFIPSASHPGPEHPTEGFIPSASHPGPEHMLQVFQPEHMLQVMSSSGFSPKTTVINSLFQPLLPKDIDLEDSEVIVLKDEKGNRYNKIKDGGPKVFYENDFISYKKARENTDTILFYIPPEIDEELDALFIAYSKKQLYEDYIDRFNSSGSLPLFFVLDLIEEESYHVPMSHIVRILEYPHPMYLIEKTSSFRVYLTRPCKI